YGQGFPFGEVIWSKLTGPYLFLYFMENHDAPFAIEETFGELLTTDFLDRETVAFYTLTVIGMDMHPTQPLSSSVLVTVLVGDINDHWPQFLDSPFNKIYIFCWYFSTGSVVCAVRAIDGDTDMNAELQYSLYGQSSDLFSINPNSGTLFLSQTLKESENESFTLLVVAKDQGFPPLTSQTEITFEIIGKNHYSPRFSEPEVIFSVPEDLPVGSVAGKIQAEDGDYGPNGVIKYHISPDSQYFPVSVGEFSGLLTLTRELDFEKETKYNLQIKATDGGWIAKSAWLNVTLIVMDVNDNPPVFSLSEYTTTVPENSKVRTKVLDVKATDMDSGINAQISYSFIAGSLDKFAIDSRNGSITTLDVFDYEQEQMFDLTIKASNTARHNLFSLAHVIIHIQDLNEFSPTFTKESFSFSVYKNVPVGTSIGKVKATDNDSGPEGEVFYLMFGHGKNFGFDIGLLSGEICTSRSLRDQGNSRVILKVLAKNSGVIHGTDIAETLVKISVIETNDAPLFTSTWYEADVKEDTPTGTSVLTVSALDQDSVLDWNRFIFRIVDGNTNSSFSIDPLNGIVLVNSDLDRERWPVYNLTVTATDHGSPPATGTTNVIVNIVDINDNAPQLVTNKIQVKENQPEGAIVARLNAFDFDLPPNQGPFTFWLSNLSAESAFFLTPDGVLLTRLVVDREHVSEYRLLVVVKDAGFPLPLSSTTTLHVRVEDENDNPSLPRNIFIEVKYFGISFNEKWIDKPTDNIFLKTSTAVLSYEMLFNKIHKLIMSIICQKSFCRMNLF
uniref:Cadherin domain-containing protein n=1 Tax=Xiphophorus maculatus TaxID=8083 RepID=A0A3B5QBC8_XIPMA